YLKTKFGISVAVLETESSVMTRASLRNQARVHRGYHYPLSIQTALSCGNNWSRFIEEYSEAIHRSSTAIYCIARDQSVIDSVGFQAVCRRVGAPLRQVSKNVAEFFDK